MPLLYLDATGAYSDPASTNYKYLRADGEWAAPDSDHEFYDATGAWSVPELVPDLSGLTDWNDATWAQIDKFGQQKVIGHAEDYVGLLHATKSVPLGDPVNKSIDFEIVDICHTDWGSDHAFVWMPKTECLTKMAHQSVDARITYLDSNIRTALMPNGSIFKAFPDDLKSVWKDINYQYVTNSSTPSFSRDTGKLVLPDTSEVSGGFRTFAANSDSDRIRKMGGAPIGWWLRSLGSWSTKGSTTFWMVRITGSFGAQTGSEYWWGICPCFAV